jgi:hypothetical protein
VKPYPQPASGRDDFAASRARLEQMVARLSDAEMMACTQHALEEYVTEAGRELQRQLMQDQLDARAAREPRLGQVAGADGCSAAAGRGRAPAPGGHHCRLGGSEPDRLSGAGRTESAPGRHANGSAAAVVFLPATAAGGA